MDDTEYKIMAAPDAQTAVRYAVAAIKRLGQLGAQDETVAEVFALAAQAEALDQGFETGFEVINS